MLKGFTLPEAVAALFRATHEAAMAAGARVAGADNHTVRVAAVAAAKDAATTLGADLRRKPVEWMIERARDAAIERHGGGVVVAKPTHTERKTS